MTISEELRRVDLTVPQSLIELGLSRLLERAADKIDQLEIAALPSEPAETKPDRSSQLTPGETEALRSLRVDCDYSERLNRMNNEEIAMALLLGVWANEQVGTWRCNLLEEVIERLKQFDQDIANLQRLRQLVQTESDGLNLHKAVIEFLNAKAANNSPKDVDLAESKLHHVLNDIINNRSKYDNR